MLNGTHVELPAMLDCREQRVQLQKKYSETYQAPLLSFCLNIPGPVKTNDALRQVFDTAMQEIRQILAKNGIGILAADERHAPTGDEALFALHGKAADIKALMTQLEEKHPLGRLFDLDVLDEQLTKLSRPTPRRCLLCSAQAQACARSRRHSVDELTDHIDKLVNAFLRSQ